MAQPLMKRRRTGRGVALNQRSSALLASYNRDDEAEVLFKRALQTDPNRAATNFRFGSFLSCFDHRGPEAVSYLRRALVLDPTLTAAQEVLDDLAP
jgi:Tfp pilus assembly protein PilF